MNGFVNVLKPAGATASDVVVCIKRVFNDKVGHLGTLDPGACGVLPCAVGQATRLFNFLTDKVKVYRAFFTFGKTTDTLDSYGVVQETCGTIPNEKLICEKLSQLTGEIDQLPPMYSAISVGGVRAYKLARNGEMPTLKTRKVTVHSLTLVKRVDATTYMFDISCSAGTYIRSLCRDIAHLCGTVGYMSGLIRLQSGCFTIDNALTLDEIRNEKENCLLNAEYVLQDVDSCVIDDKYYDDLCCGRRVLCPYNEGIKKVYCKGELFGLGKNVNGYVKLEYYLKNL